MNALFAGIDVSLAENKALFIDSSGEDVATRLRFPNNALGAGLFVHIAADTSALVTEWYSVEDIAAASL